MSNVKINNAEFQEIQTHVDKAKLLSEEANEKIWGENFDNLYNNFVTNGFLEDLYKDAESKFNLLFGGATGILCGAGSAIAGTAAGAAAAADGVATVTIASVSVSIPVAGWIIGAIILGILAIVGIYHLIKSASSVQFKHDAEKVFTDLLTECTNGTQANYLAAEDINTKLENCRLSLQQILMKIDEFNTKYANLQATAESMGVKTSLADDGTTVLSVDTEVTINGEKIELSTSEALNAFYTYENTVMSAMIEADYLARTYGYEMDYNAIVSNANSFMADTIQSGLYTHEFVDALLPSYTPDENAAYDAAVAATGVDKDQLKSMLGDISNLNIFPGLGLASAALLGTIGDATKAVNDPTPDPTDNSNNTGSTPSGTTPGGSYPSYPTSPTGGTDSGTDDEEDTKEEEDEKTNDIEIEKISEEELPESVTPEEEVDYDELAKEQFEFETDYEELLEHRSEIIEDIENKFNTGDLDSIREELKEYGYNSAEIEALLQDRFMTTKAIIQGDQDAQIAKIARELAAADGVEDFVSKYEGRPDYSALEDDGPSESLMLASEDENVVKLYGEMKEAKESYTKTVEETNEMLKEVTENKQAMEDLKAKYEKEYGEDTSKWTEDAAKEYNESIKAYNDSVTKASEQMKVLEESKTSYETAKKEFTEAREAYYEKQKNESSTSTASDTSNGNGSINNDGNAGIKPIADVDGLVPNTEGVTYLDGSGVDSSLSLSDQIDKSVVLTDNSIEIQ